MRFLLPTGIGDSVWALMKIQGVAKKHNWPRIDVGLVCGTPNKVETRAMDFVRRFKFIDSVGMCQGYSLLQDPAFREDGCWNYIADGIYEFDKEKWCVLIPNATLERGERLESWLPDIPINWDILRDFQITDSESRLAETLRSHLGRYVVFYLGPLDGNTTQGHNRNMLWKPQDWIALGERIWERFKLPIVVVGAPYDATYYDTLITPNLNGQSSRWVNMIGRTNLGELFSLTHRAEYVISYQAGVGIISTYQRTPTGIFWRPKGDSIVRDAMLSFDEGMASAWVPPPLIGNEHLPLIYGKHDVAHIINEATRRGWA